MKLSLQHKRFVEEYMLDLNATAAYKRAGYKASGRSAENNASRLLGHPAITAALNEALAKRSARVQRTTDDVLLDLLAIKQDAVKMVIDRDGNSVMIDRTAALRALELEGKHYKMFTDKAEITGKDGGALDLNIGVRFV